MQNHLPEHTPKNQPDDPSTVIRDAQTLRNPDRESTSPVLTASQLIGFLKDKEPLEFEREKTDRPLS